jgi:trehalose 6-phosphate synthase/phosphatase
MASPPLAVSDGGLPDGLTRSVQPVDQQVSIMKIPTNDRRDHRSGDAPTDLVVDAPPPPALSYEGDQAAKKTPRTAAEAVEGSRSGVELLSHLRLVDVSYQDSPMWNPRLAHPGLQLTGRIISAAFCIPYKLGFCPEADWV